MRTLAAAGLACLCVAACGEQASAAGGGADLRVTVRPEGPSGPAERRHIRCARLGEGATRRICRRLGGLFRSDLAPTPAGVGCPEIYGGPAVARVTGRLRGKPVDARFKLTNGCEIDRWQRNRRLLGPAPLAQPTGAQPGGSLPGAL
jgi:hypothetical protein